MGASSGTLATELADAHRLDASRRKKESERAVQQGPMARCLELEAIESSAVRPLASAVNVKAANH